MHSSSVEFAAIRCDDRHLFIWFWKRTYIHSNHVTSEFLTNIQNSLKWLMYRSYKCSCKNIISWYPLKNEAETGTHNTAQIFHIEREVICIFASHPQIGRKAVILHNYFCFIFPVPSYLGDILFIWVYALQHGLQNFF